MSIELNSITIGGNLTSDPEVKNVGDNTVVKITVAANRSWKNKSGEKQERTTFVDCDFWGKQGEVIAKHFAKGKPIIVQGRLETDSWENDKGEKRSKLKITGSNFSFVPDGKGPNGSSNSKSSAQTEEEVPF